MAKKREYCDKIREVEHAVLTPLVSSITGDIGKETAVACKRLAELIAQKRKSEYGVTLACMDAMHLIFCLDTISCYGNKWQSFFKPESRCKHRTGL